MAACSEVQGEVTAENLEGQSLELESLLSIFGEEIKIITPEKEFLIDIDIHSAHSLELLLLTTTKRSDNASPHPPPPHLTRSTSTKPALVTHLPPVTLYIRYHDDYPSGDCPHFHLSARWLSERRARSIGEKLRLLFTPGWPVVYNWITYISNDLISELEEEDEEGGGIGTKEEPPMSNRHLFVRSISEFNDVEEYDRYLNHKLFMTGKHSCSVCFEEKYGDQFVSKCEECKDENALFCKNCVREHCQTLLGDGRVTSFTCLSTDCTRTLSDVLVETLLSQKEFQRYLQLREQVSLDSIPGMVFCPRSACGSRTVSDPRSDLAVCAQCSFPFCKLCRQTWHGIERCIVFDKVQAVESEENEEEKKAKAKERDEERRMEEFKSILWMKSHRNVRECPICSTVIQKVGGCNKMTCWKCGGCFCWICMQRITGYEHFDLKGCEMFRDEDYRPPQEEKEDKEASDIATIPDQVVNITTLENLLESACPRCGLIEQKWGAKNWVTCRRCKMPFCLLCREPCYGRYHFSEYGCKEYSTFKEDLAAVEREEKERKQEQNVEVITEQ